MPFHERILSREKIDRILLYRIPADCIPEEGIAGGEILASRVPVYGTKDAGRGLWLRLKNTCKQFNFPESNSAGYVRAAKRGIKNHCRDVFQCGRLAVWLPPGRSRSHDLCVATILGWQRRSRYLQFSRERISKKTKTLVFMSRPKTILSEYNQSLTTRNMV